MGICTVKVVVVAKAALTPRVSFSRWSLQNTDWLLETRRWLHVGIVDIVVVMVVWWLGGRLAAIILYGDGGGDGVCMWEQL